MAYTQLTRIMLDRTESIGKLGSLMLSWMCCVGLWMGVSPELHGGAFVLPAGVERVEALAFSQCSLLTEVDIPASVVEIGADAFAACGSLNLAIFRGDAPVMGSGVFGGAGNGFQVHYTRSAIGFSTSQWMGYSAYPLANSAPELLPGGNRSVPVGALIQIVLDASDADSDALSFSAAGGN